MAKYPGKRNGYAEANDIPFKLEDDIYGFGMMMVFMLNYDRFHGIFLDLGKPLRTGVSLKPTLHDWYMVLFWDYLKRYKENSVKFGASHHQLVLSEKINTLLTTMKCPNDLDETQFGKLKDTIKSCLDFDPKKRPSALEICSILELQKPNTKPSQSLPSPH